MTVDMLQNLDCVDTVESMLCTCIREFGSGALSGKNLLVRIVENYKIDLEPLPPPHTRAKNNNPTPKLFSIILDPALNRLCT